MQLLFLGPDNQYPRYIGDLLSDYPDFDLEKDSLPEGWFLVEETEPPVVSDNERLIEKLPTITDGKYRQTWDKRLLTQEEIDLINAPLELPNTENKG